MWNCQRSAQVSTELIPLQDLPCQCEIVSRIQLVVADEFEDATVVPVGTAFGGCIEERAPTVIFGGIRALLDRKFLQRVNGGLNECATLMLFRYVDTIKQEGGSRTADTADDVAVHNLRSNGE